MTDGIVPLMRMARHSICEDCGYRMTLREFYGVNKAHIDKVQRLWDSLTPREREARGFFPLDVPPRENYERYICGAPQCENSRRNLYVVSMLECGSFFPSSLGTPQRERGYSSCSAFIEGELEGRRKKPGNLHRGGL